MIFLRGLCSVVMGLGFALVAYCSVKRYMQQVSSILVITLKMTPVPLSRLQVINAWV